MPEEPTSSNTEVIPYKFDCHRSYLHRYIPADGVWVGLNGFQKIILNFYNDTPPLPKTIIGEATADRKAFTSKKVEVIEETDAQSYRQFEVSVNLSVTAAKTLLETLKTFIKMAEDREKELATK
jgi:hypothetical protein